MPYHCRRRPFKNEKESSWVRKPEVCKERCFLVALLRTGINVTTERSLWLQQLVCQPEACFQAARYLVWEPHPATHLRNWKRMGGGVDDTQLLPLTDGFQRTSSAYRYLLYTRVCNIMSFKGILHPKMKIHSLSNHHYADGGVGEVFDRLNLRCPTLPTVPVYPNWPHY